MYYVDYDKKDTGFQLYTIYPEAIEALLDTAEFAFDPRKNAMTAFVAELPEHPLVSYYNMKELNRRIPIGVKQNLEKNHSEMETLAKRIDSVLCAVEDT